MQHLDEGTIHGWLDGQLPQGEAAAAEAHVAECRHCADAVAEARGLIAASSRILMSLDGVPRGVAPQQATPDDDSRAADVVVGTNPNVPHGAEPNVVIDLRSRAAGGARPIQRPRRRWLRGPSLAAAATIVVAVGTFALMRTGGDDVSVAPDAASPRQAGPFADSSAPVATAARAVAAPAAPSPAAAPQPALGVAARSNEAPQRRAAEVRALASGARTEADQIAPRDPQPERTDAFSAKVGSAVAANAPAPAREEAKRAAKTAEPSGVADEVTRLAKEREAAAADSLLARRQVAAALPAAPPPAVQSKPDTSADAASRGRDVQQRPTADRRDVRSDADAPATTGTIRGRVTDGNSTGVANAQVTIVGTSIGMTTNQAGEFVVGGVRPGTHRLTVRRIGFDSVSRYLAVGAGQTTTADVVLVPVPTSLNEVVVTGAASAPRQALGSAQATQNPQNARGRAGAPAVPLEAAPGAAVTAGQSNAVGCYEMGITPLSQQARTNFRQTPRRVALDAEIMPANADGIWYRARDLARTGAVPNGLWRPVGTDGIELEWTYGTRIARIRLTGPAGAMMRGTVQEIDRSTGTGEAGSVVSVKASCTG